jgi:hypothetical protein
MNVNEALAKLREVAEASDIPVANKANPDPEPIPLTPLVVLLEGLAGCIMSITQSLETNIATAQDPSSPGK